MERFTIGMRNGAVQTAPPAYFIPLMPISSTKVGAFVQEVARTVTNLGEVEPLRPKKKKKKRNKTNFKKP